MSADDAVAKPTPVYANIAALAISQWDCRVDFGYILGKSTGEAGEETLEVESRVSVVMSPQQAKALMLALQRQVAKFEALFGPLNLEPKTAQAKDIEV